MNDLELSEHISKVKRLAGRLDQLCRDKREIDLYMTLDVIHDEARKAMWRMNNVRFQNETTLPPIAPSA